MNNVVKLMRQPRVPRRTFSTNSTNTIINSRYISDFPLTIATGASNSNTFELINPANSSNLDAGQAVAKNFSNYVVRSATLTYTPAVGTTTLGTVFIGYVDNAEIMSKVIAGTYTALQIAQLAQAASCATSTPVWQQTSLTMNRPPRKKTFSVDSTDVSSTLECDRVHQGMFVVAYFGPSAAQATLLGHISLHYVASLENPQAAYVSGI